MMGFLRLRVKIVMIVVGLLTAQVVQALPFTEGIETGARQMKEYLPLLKGKKVALLINQTSVVDGKLLLDTLLSSGVQVVKVFVPEHGFRGTADAGAHISNEVDTRTGLPVISLYGKNKKPTKAQLADVDILVYDLQDVGVRFYTYISTLEYAMEACIESQKQLLILDRPNPNGHLVDGPVLDTALRSFVGMQPIPVLYGMTAGEYAKMLLGEAWIVNADGLDLKVITCKNYAHSKTYYALPVSPSPNLRTMTAVYLYPGLCLFEGTYVSVGRGTDKPFRQWGHPDFKGKSSYFFTPESTSGASKPVLENQRCYGELADENYVKAFALTEKGMYIAPLLKAYSWSPQKDQFFNSFFEKLAGTKVLRQQIISGKSEQEIRSSWAPGLEQFRKIREKYLLYAD
jgi:uncharacterized protein YbbC (DUF1343 family)